MRRRKARPDDKEKGRFGFLRPPLTEQERKAIKDKKRLKETPAGQGQAEIRKRQYESRTGSEEWADLVTEEYNREEDPNDSMTVDGTMVPTTPTKSRENQDENLNRISPQQAAVSLQSTQEIENEKLRKQIETMSKHADQMAAQNDRYRQRNENLEDKLRKDTNKEKKA